MVENESKVLKAAGKVESTAKLPAGYDWAVEVKLPYTSPE